MNKNKLNINIRVLTMGSVALIASGGVLAAAPPVSVVPLNAVTGLLPGGASLNYGINSAGASADSNFTNGQISNAGLITGDSVCTTAGVTCTVMDGSGPGMYQVMIQSAAGNYIELLVGSKDTTSGLFLSDTFVSYDGNAAAAEGGAGIPGAAVSSMADKLIIEDPTALANAAAYAESTTAAQVEGAFSMSNEWTHGLFAGPSSFSSAISDGDGGDGDGAGDDIPTFISQTIQGVQTFYAEGVVSEDGNFDDGLIRIDQGDTAATTTTNTNDAQAMGDFVYRFQDGGDTDEGIAGDNYAVGVNAVLTLGSQTLAVSATQGLSAVYIGQDMNGFNGSGATNYTVDDPTQRQFGYVSYETYNDPVAPDDGSNGGGNAESTIGNETAGQQLGNAVNGGSIAMTSLVGGTAGHPFAGATGASVTVAGLSNNLNNNSVNDPTFGANVAGVFTNPAALLSQWTSVVYDGGTPFLSATTYNSSVTVGGTPVANPAPAGAPPVN